MTELSSDRDAFLRATMVSRETLEKLDVYAALLCKWQSSINLVGPDTLKNLWSRHFLDSLQISTAAGEAARRFVDLGAGAGFPGLIIAIVRAGYGDTEVILVESNAKKAAFMQAVIRETSAPARVINERIERVVPTLPVPDIVTARALAPLSKLIDWSYPLLKRGAIALFPKGRDLDKEVADAARCWSMTTEVLPSCIAHDSSILKLVSVSPVAISTGTEEQRIRQ